ncbi:MAG: alanine--tRNA ligase [Candidatus Kapabacteria bacterium]|nr:alanine--tRNA ligase [Candidatus Kapabacteria bacterium]
MTSRQIRQTFLDFFAERGHRIVQSAPVVPHGDPTLLFTNAGMNQFKDVFLGTGKRDYSRAADTQKCIRVSGKHNDLEEVGYDTYHHTLFEMLGNWSFGDYFKEEAIGWSWELLTDVLKLPKERIHATVYRTDDESMEIWKKYLPESHIHRFDEKDNFWEMGDTGPCGPCTEIHFDRTPDLSGGPLVNSGVPEVIEIWNNVFIQYNRTADGTLEDLPSRHVDTGMGFERLCAVMQQKDSNYDTDVFQPIIGFTEQLSGRTYRTELDHPDGVAMRVIADHIRTLSFAIADGAHPGNEGRGYVLRRILRRAARYARNLGLTEPVLWKHVSILCETMGDVFPELIERQSVIERIIKAEEESFLATLDRGLDEIWNAWIVLMSDLLRQNDPPYAFSQDIFGTSSRDGKHWGIGLGTVVSSTSQLNDHFRWLTAREAVDQVIEITGFRPRLSGEKAFLLSDTFGFPIDLTQLICREQMAIGVDVDGFNVLIAEQRARSRAARKSHSVEATKISIDAVSRFIGYNTTETSSAVLHVEGNAIVLAETPFYVEMGGQVGDTGQIVVGGIPFRVEDVRKNGDAIVHICETDVDAAIGDIALAQVDASRRKDIEREHSVTHLLHESLRRVLGTHVQQAGSLVAPNHLRFDFAHFERIRLDELQAVEDMVNEKIFESIDVHIEEMSIEKARTVPGAKMFFGDKYGDSVRVVFIDDKVSVEFCGGTHVRNTSEIGLFKIVAESSVASGVRRIEAIAGRSIPAWLKELESKREVVNDDMLRQADRIKQLEKELASLKTDELKTLIPSIVEKAITVNDIRIATARVSVSDAEQMKDLGDELRSALKSSGIGLLGAVIDDKVQLVCVVTDDLTKTYSAGKLIGVVAKELGGGGGGKPHMATAGGKDVEKLDDVLAKFSNSINQ